MGDSEDGLKDAPGIWWSPSAGLIRGGTNGGYEDAIALTPAAGLDPRARQLLTDISALGRQVEGGYSLRIERYRGDPEDAVYAILKWDMSQTGGIIAWRQEAVGRHVTIADAVRDAVAQTGWT